jgi:hypothetical protein
VANRAGASRHISLSEIELFTKGGDQEDALRASFTYHRKQNYRTWFPLFYFLIDIACFNSYLLWLWGSTEHIAYDKQSHSSHRAFMIKLSDKLLHANNPKSNEKDCSFDLPLTALTHHHIIMRTESRGRCEWGKRHPPGYQRKQAPYKRVFETDITAKQQQWHQKHYFI